MDARNFPTTKFLRPLYTDLVITRPWIIILALSGVTVAILYRFNPEQHSFYPVCPSYQWFGFQCATCGGLRAVHALLHGSFTEAWSFNPLVLIVISLGAAEAIHTLVRGPSMRRWLIFAGAIFVGMIAFTLWRNF